MSWSPSRKKRGSVGDASATSPDISVRHVQAPPPPPWFLNQSTAELISAFQDLEWQQRNRLSAGATATDAAARWARTTILPNSISRNRYANIEPFAANRIKLKVGEGMNDYINASPIVLGNRRYISTQGPKENCVTHFYRMLASETSTVAVVVMLTQTYEAGREKCYNYWPQEIEASALELFADPEDTDDLFEGSVSLLSTHEDKEAKCDVSHLRLRTRSKAAADGQPQEPWQEKDVYHLHFGGWPDFSVPEGDDRQALLGLLRLSRKLNADAPSPTHSSFPEAAESGTVDELNPRIVHCSAGVGRTGTFIALDYLLGRLEDGDLDEVPDGTDPIAETVDRLRQQRMMMVQGESQFHFLYEILRELWVERWQKRQSASAFPS